MVCSGKLRYDQNQSGFFCQNHPDKKVLPSKLRVKFGREILQRFNDFYQAEQFLAGLRFKTVEGSFDARDYKKDHPLGFETQSLQYLERKKQKVGHNQYRDIRCNIYKAIDVWHHRNVKTINYGEIDDFLYGLKVSDKTRSNAKSALLGFFKWLNKREQIPVPTFPECDFELGWRNIITLELQQKIIAEVKRISYHINPKVWIGIKWLATYIAMRPNELRQLKHRHINVSGFFVLPPKNTKEREPKLVAMLDEDIQLYKSMPTALPDVFFFRHVKGNGAVKPGQQFGKDFLYKWWKQACKNLVVDDVDLYGGTRHSTATALSEHFTTQEIMTAGSMHKTNKAAIRYIQAEKNKSILVYQKVREMQGSVTHLSHKKRLPKLTTF
jgi:hypothetical protein